MKFKNLLKHFQNLALGLQTITAANFAIILMYILTGITPLMEFRDAQLIVGIVFLFVILLLQIYITLGIFFLKNRARKVWIILSWFTVATYAYGTFIVARGGQISDYFTVHDIYFLPLTLFSLYYLTRPHTKQLFK